MWSEIGGLRRSNKISTIVFLCYLKSVDEWTSLQLDYSGYSFVLWQFSQTNYEPSNDFNVTLFDFKIFKKYQGYYYKYYLLNNHAYMPVDSIQYVCNEKNVKKQIIWAPS